MKISALKYGVLSWASSLIIIIILLMPFHAFMTIWLSHVFGHYTLLRLWKEFLLVLLGVCAVFLLLTDRKIRGHTLSRRLVWVIVAYGVVTIMWGLVAFAHGEVTQKALGYGLISNLRFPLFFLISWGVSLRLSRLHAHWQWIVLWPATIVVVFGLLQFFILPKDFLGHFGYSAATIFPYETINHNDSYIRVMSTLRGANPLGAYLLIPIAMLSTLLLRKTLQKRQLALLLLTLLCLGATFSRAAWLGAVVSLGVVASVCLTTKRSRRYGLIAAALTILLLGLSLLALRHNTQYQNYALHTQTNSAIKTTSNGGHASALKAGLRDVLHEPLGRGTGTAGPASVYNQPHRTRIAENYYLQIGQETGLLGLLLFLLLTLGVGYLLWLRRADSLALSLFASFVGLTLVNLLSHAWADDTLAYVWWGLAGIAMAPNLKELRDRAEAQ